MNRMNGNLNTKAGRVFFSLASRSITTQERMRHTVEAEDAIHARNDLAKSILAAIDKAAAIEDLIHYEMVLQTLDRLSAQSESDISGIENAQRDYKQLAKTVSQMRRNPEEYFQANMAFRDTGGDFRKLPRGRIQHIHANVARLRNRMTFVPEEERNVWNARVRLAEKTSAMLRAMHKSLVKKYENKE